VSTTRSEQSCAKIGFLSGGKILEEILSDADMSMGGIQ